MRKDAQAKGLIKSRLLVCARGIEAWVRELSVRADNGDHEAENALGKLREAFETAAKVLGEEPMPEDEYLVLMQGLLILEEALKGHSDYSIEALRAIAKQTADDCRRLGYGDLDISWLFRD